MVLGYTVNEGLPFGGKVFFLGGAGRQNFSSCPQPPDATTKFWVYMVGEVEDYLLSGPHGPHLWNRETLPGCRAPVSTRE